MSAEEATRADRGKIPVDANIAIEVFKTVLTKRYADFEGRAGRAEFWYFALTSFVASLVCDVIGIIAGTAAVDGLYQLAILLPALAVSARRLHDIDMNGWWILLPFVPLIAGLVVVPLAMNARFEEWYSVSFASPLFTLIIKLALAYAGAFAVLVYWFIQPGTPGANRFGAEVRAMT